MTTIEYFEKTYKDLWRHLYLTDDDDVDAWSRWLDLADETIDALKAFVQSSDLNEIEKKRCRMCRANLTYLQGRFLEKLSTQKAQEEEVQDQKEEEEAEEEAVRPSLQNDTNQIEVIEEIVKALRDSPSNAEDINDLRIELDITNEAVTALDALMQLPELNRAIRKRCQTCMCHLLYFKSKLTDSLRAGGNVQVPEAAVAQPGVEIAKPEQNEGAVIWRNIQSAFRNRIQTGIIINRSHKDIAAFFNDAFTLFQRKISEVLNEHNALKVNAELAAQYIVKKSGEETVEVKYFNTANTAIYKTTDLVESFEHNIRRPIVRDMEEFQERDSGWTLKAIVGLTINMNKLNPLKGSSWLPLPESIANKKACVNIKNDDCYCFKWAVLSALYPNHNSDRVNYYRKFESHAKLKFDGITFPVQPKDISKFEKMNSISINLYMLKKYGRQYEVSPCHVTAQKRVRHINLLIVQNFYIDENIGDQTEMDDEDDEDGEKFTPQFHYIWIKDMSRLISAQVSKRQHKCYVCDRCLHYFRDEKKLDAHEEDCSQLNKCRINLPKRGENTLKFDNHDRIEPVPYCIYADFECMLKPIEDDEHTYQEHEAYSIGLYVKCNFDDTQSNYNSYRKVNSNDESPAQWLVKQLKNFATELENVYKNAKAMRLSDSDYLHFKTAANCHICKKPFKDKNIKVRDHCHLTGRFRGSAHQSCNLNYQNARFIPVIFHNLTGYDAHFIIKEIATAPDFKGRVSLIPQNKERYIAFTKYIDGSDINFRFIDSLSFMPSSLDKLSSYLEHTHIVQREFGKDGYTQDQIQLLKRKGIFPYDYISSLEKLTETQLPPKEKFFSELTQTHISDEDYEHAKNVWNTFGLANLGEYSDLYTKTDVILLADVFENFRTTCLEAYKLDPAHYYTTPGLTWDAMLKYTGIELELLTDIDMVMFIEKGIRGGLSQCCNRYAKANNKYMGEAYNENEEDKYLMYYDVNNLYGWAMTQPLPYRGFQWIPHVEYTNFDIADDCPYGYILEVDLEYGEELHDAHKDLPLCPEHRAPPGSKQKKLLTTLYKKERYVIHYRTLKQALKYGLRLVQVHRALYFEQKPWLKPYVDLNTEKRKQAKNEFEKLFFKLMVNAVYGKTMENERKRVDVKLINKWEGRYGAEARIAQPNFHSTSIFDENLVAIQLSWTSITIKKPIYVGLCVLDLSKILVYDFHYGYMLDRFGDKCKLLYTDTDSLVYEIRNNDLYEIMKQDIERFDTSDYSEDNQFGMPLKNKKVLGLMKDECNGKIMTEFIGLRSKMYSILIQDNEPIKKAKGVKAQTLKKTIDFEDYRRCLLNWIVIKRNQCSIRSKLHVVKSVKESKIALNPDDDKRYLLPDSTDTLPWGHYRNRDAAILREATRGEKPEVEGEEEAEKERKKLRETSARVRGVGEWLEKRQRERAALNQLEANVEDGPQAKRTRVN